MKPVPCPNCGARIALEDSAQGAKVLCPLCGNRFDAPIDVHVEPDESASPERDEDVEVVTQELEEIAEAEAKARRLNEDLRRLFGSAQGRGPRVITIQRQVQGNPGCCLGGCAVLILLAVIFFMGLQSLLGAIFG